MADGMRAKQRAAVLEMFDFDNGAAAAASAAAATTTSSPWKVLIFDKVGRDILAPLVKVKELREMGVTLHLSLEKPRQAVPGVPAVYLCAATPDNIAAIAKDCTEELYSAVHINFVSQVSRKRLESLAEAMLGLPSIKHIHVYDRSLNFISYTKDLFALPMSNTFKIFNSRKTAEDDMERRLQEIVLGISHVFQTQHQIPIVGHVRSGPASELANRVISGFNDLHREQMMGGGAGAMGSSSHRPLLLVVDRAYDLAVGLHHPFSYHGLLVDALGMKLNKVDFTVDGQQKSIEMDPDNDYFWNTNSSAEFGSVGERIDAAVVSFKKEYSALTQKEGGTGDANSDQAAQLMLQSAPKLLDKKRSVDGHTLVAHQVLKQVHASKLDALNGVERGLIERTDFDEDMFAELLSNPSLRKEDRERLFLVAQLTTEGDDRAAKVEAQRAKIDTEEHPAAALKYLKQLRAWSMPGGQGSSDHVDQQDQGAFRFATALFNKAFSSSVKTNLPLTLLVDALVSHSGGVGSRNNKEKQKLLDTVSCVDPRNKSEIDVNSLRCGEVFVFMVGGGCVAEYEDLKRWEGEGAGQTHRPAVTYGCTELLTGDALLSQLDELGQEC